MKLLVLGGTVFLGRHVVESALARGHSVTLFNRGRHSPNLFPKVEKLRGDRDGDLSALSGRRFDAVIDTTTYTPRQARRIAEILDGRIEHYTFISSVSAYAAAHSKPAPKKRSRLRFRGESRTCGQASSPARTTRRIGLRIGRAGSRRGARCLHPGARSVRSSSSMRATSPIGVYA